MYLRTARTVAVQVSLSHTGLLSIPQAQNALQLTPWSTGPLAVGAYLLSISKLLIIGQELTH